MSKKTYYKKLTQDEIHTTHHGFNCARDFDLVIILEPKDFGRLAIYREYSADNKAIVDFWTRETLYENPGSDFRAELLIVNA